MNNYLLHLIESHVESDFNEFSMIIFVENADGLQPLLSGHGSADRSAQRQTYVHQCLFDEIGGDRFR